MNRFGASMPNCGWFQRTSASTPRTTPSARPTSGWYSSTNSPRSTAGRSVEDSAWRVIRCALRSGSKRVQRALPSAFAQYSVVSAACISPVAVVPAAGRSTTPMDAETDSRCPARSKGAWRAASTAAGEVGELLGAGGVLDQQRELVAAEPRHQVAPPGRGRRGRRSR